MINENCIGSLFINKQAFFQNTGASWQALSFLPFLFLPLPLLFHLSSSVNFRHESSMKGFPNPGGGGGTPYNGLYGEAPPERGTFFRLEGCERVGISRVQVWVRVGKTAI